MSSTSFSRIDTCIDQTIKWLRITQDDQGRWLGSTRGLDTAFYAIGLALAGEPHDSPVVQDLCDYFESCITDEGGFGDYPGEPANGFQTAFILPILEWGRPNSATITSAKKYLRRTCQFYNDPRVALAMWACQPNKRQRVVADKGPSGIMRKLGLSISKKHSSVRISAQKEFPRYYRRHRLLERLLLPLLIRSMTYPPLDCLEEAARVAPSPTGFDIMLLIHAGLRRLANDTTAGALRLYEFAKARRNRFIYSNGAYEWVTVLTAEVFFTRAFAMHEDYGKAVAGLRGLKYQGNGWLSGDMATVHVFDTALIATGLLEVGFPKSDTMLQDALDYLRRARSPKNGMWAWAYTEAMGEKRPYEDTDDTGLICTLLVACGEPRTSDILEKALTSLLAMQDPDGGFSLFDGVLRPNWCWVSNTSRSLQALIACGLTIEDPNVQRAVNWLLSQQLPDNSWVDGWCTRYIYGTVTALEGLIRTGILAVDDRRIIAARNWLLDQQNSDGGWGEDWSGGKSESNCEHTGLAIYGLCIASATGHHPREAIERGVSWLIDHQRADGTWDSIYNLNYGFGAGTSDSQLPIAWALLGLGQARRILAHEQTEAPANSNKT